MDELVFILQVPLHERNDSVKKMIGMDKIKLSENFLSKKNKLVRIDLNGIAQGYSVDVVAEFFESKGIKSYVVELGGEIRAKGPKPDQSAIKIGIEGPPENEFEEEFNKRDQYLKKITLSKEALSSYIHMSINRWFSSEQRALELMTYSFAAKYYSRILSQSK